MSLYSSQMSLLVPEGNSSTSDSIHFQVRPRLRQLGIQCWGLTKFRAPRTYFFDIQMEGKWDEFATTLAEAQGMVLREFGLQMVQNGVIQQP